VGGGFFRLLRFAHNLADEICEVEVAVDVLAGVGVLEDLVHLLVAQLVPQAGEHVTHLSGGDEALTFPVESLERLVKVVEGSLILHLGDLGVDGQELFELVSLNAHLVSSSMARDDLLDGVEAQAVQHVSGLEGIDLTVTAIPEVKQLEDVLDLFDFVS